MRRSMAVALAASVVAAPLLVATPAQAEPVVKVAKLERSIQSTLAKQVGVSVKATCPDEVAWVKGKVFYCRVKARDGQKGRVKVTLKSNATKGRLSWVVV